MDQLDSALRALDVTLDEDALARLDEIFPGPGGDGPGGLRLVNERAGARGCTLPEWTSTEHSSTPQARAAAYS